MEDRGRQIAASVLVCPSCGHSPIALEGDRVVCSRCGAHRVLDGHVVSTSETPAAASFDAKHDMIPDHNRHRVVWQMLYERQNKVIEEALGTDRVAMDIGCGPAVPYDRPPGVTLIGVDPSLPSLVANGDIDLGVQTSATQMPIGDDTMDVVVAGYALHHMVGPTVPASLRNVEAAFGEMARVSKPGGTVIVLEICPWPPVWLAERIGWRLARRVLGPFIDFCFWPAQLLRDHGTRSFPGATLEERRYAVRWSAMFPPVIGLPWLRIPWFLYPFHVTLFRWQLPEGR